MSLKQITTRAKKLYKTGKFAKWTDAIKAASKQIKPAKPAKKARAKKVAAVKTSSKTHTDKNRITANIQVGKMGSIGLDTIGAELWNLEAKITRLKQKKKDAKLIAEKRDIQQEISNLSKQHKTLRAYLNSRARFTNMR